MHGVSKNMHMNKNIRNIGFTYNIKHVKPSLTDKLAIEEAEYDEPKVIEGVIKALESLGVKVFPVEANEEAYDKLKNLKGKIDLVFNYAEGLHGKDREAQIPAMLEILQIPYTGGSPLSYALGLDKIKCKEIWSFYKIPTPKWQEYNSHNFFPFGDLSFPVIIKPSAEGSSKGIFKENLVYQKIELERLIKKVAGDYKQKVIVEEYLPGREFTVAVLDTPPVVLPIIEVTFNELPNDMPKFDHYEAKWIYDSPEKKSDPLICPAPLKSPLKHKIEMNVLKAFAVLGLSDWARFDIRLNKNGEPNIIEVNCPPGIIPDPKENSRFPRAARVAGLEFPEMLEAIISSAGKRYRII